MTLSLQRSDEKKNCKDNLFHFYEAPCYKLLSFAYMTLYYLLSHFMLFLVSLLSVIIADLDIFYRRFSLISSHLPFVIHEHFLCADVAALCVDVLVSC